MGSLAAKQVDRVMANANSEEYSNLDSLNVETCSMKVSTEVFLPLKDNRK